MESLETRKTLIAGGICAMPTKGCVLGLLDAYVAPPGIEILFALRGRSDRANMRVVIIMHGVDGLEVSARDMTEISAHAEALLSDYLNNEIGFDNRLQKAYREGEE